MPSYHFGFKSLVRESRRMVSEGAHLGVGRGGVGDVRGRHLAILAHALDELGRIAVKVVAHIRQRNLGRVQVLEGDVNLAESRFKQLLLRLHARTRRIRVERERLAVQVHVLQLRFIVPGRVFNREVDVGRVRARRVGEDSRGGFADGQAKLFGLFSGVLAHKVHLIRFVLLSGELDGTIQQVHLVDEQVAEDAGAVDDDIDSRASEFF